MSNQTTTTGLAADSIGHSWSPLSLIPGRDGAPYKAESRRDGEDPGTLERFTVWISDDPREEPHTHPWPFVSTILTGGYTEKRYRQAADGEWQMIGEYVWRAGDVVEVPAGDAHRVFDVLPGTTTHMRIGKLTAGPRDWGHVEWDVTGFHSKLVPAVASAKFLADLKALNSRPA